MYLVPCCSTKVNLDFEITSLFFRPELFRFESLLQNDNRTNLDHAFNMANEEFSVPKLLDPAGETVFLPFTFLFFLLGRFFFYDNFWKRGRIYSSLLIEVHLIPTLPLLL